MYFYSRIRIDPCAGKTIYIRFQANFRQNKMSLKFATYFVVDASSQIIQFRRSLFFISDIIFHPFKDGNWEQLQMN